MVYYRQYRPQKISELDSPKLRETLTAVLSSKNIPHAYLFTGPKGLGKTSTARIIAKVLNCTAKKRDGIEPCNECDQCVSITNGSNIDVLEIDGASNRGIDEIRELRERVNLAPSAAKMKVYIIDEVHMLTTEAFNALLKTIEEPPAHVVFIFATTEPQKVPSTIISRCFHVSLERASKEEIIHALKRIVKNEKIDIDDDALDFIARLGDGGYRDATKILEEMVAIAGDKKIDKEFIEKQNNTTGVSLEVDELLQNLKQKNTVGSLTKIKVVVDQGVSIKYFIEQLLSKLHAILLSNNGLGKGQVNAPSFDFEELRDLVNYFSEAYQQTKYAVVPSLPLELAVVKYCQNVIANEVKQSDRDKIAASPSAPRNDTGRMTVNDALKKEQNLKVKQVLSGEKPVEKKKVETSATQENLPKDVQDAHVLLENLIYKVKPYNHSVAGVLRGCTIQSMDNDTIIFVTPYKFHKEKLDEQKIKDILEQVVREVTGKHIKVMVELKK